jgi:hypothetical protein
LLEHTRRRKHGWPVLLSLVVAMGGCADDIPATPDTRGDSTTGDTDPSPITFSMSESTGSNTTEVADDTGSGGTSSTSSTGPTVDDTTTTSDDTTTTSDDTTTGGEALPGQTMNQLVSAGERSSSPNYTLVYTFGQPSSLQSTHQSTSYTIHGGLIGANGSRP